MTRLVTVLLILVSTCLSGCVRGDSTPNYPPRDKVIEVAASCGVENFEPTEAGAGIAAYVDPTIEDAEQKEDCIYDALRAEGFIVTR